MMKADLVLYNARVFTAASTGEWAQTIAVSGSRFTYAGDEEGVKKFVGPNTIVRDLTGGFVMPGMVDVHAHPVLAGRTELFELQLVATDTLDQVIQQIAQYASELHSTDWIVGAGWGPHLFEQINSASVLARLDEATGDHPTVLTDFSRHNRWVNSAVMRLADISGEQGASVDPVTSTYTGVLFEAAGLPIARLQARVAGLDRDQEQAAYRWGIQTLNSYGITAFQDAASTAEMMEALHSLDTRSELDAWVVSSLIGNDEIFGAEVVGQALIDCAAPFVSMHHRPSFVKIFLDGIPPSRTAAFLEPYLPDDVHGCRHFGTTILDPQRLADIMRSAARQGMGTKVHCTGDASVRLVLDTAGELRSEGFTTPVQIAHGQYISPDDLPRLAALGVNADISPFAWYPGAIAASISQVIPAERARQIHPNRDLIDSGALVAAGSDWPVSDTPNVWAAIHGLVTREDPNGELPGALWPEQAITLTEALGVFTINGARMIGMEFETGSIEVGKSADFVLLDRDPFASSPRRLCDVRANETWFAGRRVFSR